MGDLRVFQHSFKGISKNLRKFPGSFKGVFKGGLKHINSLLKKVGYVVVECQPSQLPEQKEGLFVLQEKDAVPVFIITMMSTPMCILNKDISNWFSNAGFKYLIPDMNLHTYILIVRQGQT